MTIAHLRHMAHEHRANAERALIRGNMRRYRACMNLANKCDAIARKG